MKVNKRKYIIDLTNTRLNKNHINSERDKIRSGDKVINKGKRLLS